MQLQIERGKNANAKFEWIDFAVRNNDITSTLNQAPLTIRKLLKINITAKYGQLKPK